jgi:tetratricopeptide (TPR) repeat protein
MELHRGNVEKARGVFIRGLQARCTAAASVYHGLAKLELSQGNIESARSILLEGLKEAENQDTMMDNHQRDRASFLTHTLGMLELRCNRAADAKLVFLDGIQRHGGTSQLLLGAALCELKLGNENRARLLFEQAVTADRKHAQAWQSWGVIEMRAGNYKLAKTLFELGLQNDATHGALWQAYGKNTVHCF